VAADSKRNLIFVPTIWTVPAGTVPAGDLNTVGGTTTTVGALACGGNNGCIVVYKHDVDNDADDDDDDHDHDHDHDGDHHDRDDFHFGWDR
jgi:hypothetical protein